MREDTNLEYSPHPVPVSHQSQYPGLWPSHKNINLGSNLQSPTSNISSSFLPPDNLSGSWAATILSTWKSPRPGMWTSRSADIEDPLSVRFWSNIFFSYYHFKDLPHVSGDSQLFTIKKLDILAEKISSPVPVFDLPPSLGSNVSDQVDRLTLSLSTPNLPKDNSESNLYYVNILICYVPFQRIFFCSGSWQGAS